MKAETKYKDIHGSWTGGCGWRYGTSTMDQALSSCTRTACTNNNNISKQQEYYTTSRKLQSIKLEEKTSYIHIVLLCDRQNKKRWGQGGLLPHYLHAGRLLHKGSAFKRIWSVILNLPDTDKANSELRSLLENEKWVIKKWLQEHKNRMIKTKNDFMNSGEFLILLDIITTTSFLAVESKAITSLFTSMTTLVLNPHTWFPNHITTSPHHHIKTPRLRFLWFCD